MVKKDLEQGWIYAGTRYGPGEGVEIPDDVAKELEAKGAFEKAEEEATDETATDDKAPAKPAAAPKPAATTNTGSATGGE